MPSGRTFGGGLLAGWGVFNVVEGLVNHQILGLHHVRTGPDQLAWDIGLLLVSALVALAGRGLLRRGESRPRNA